MPSLFDRILVPVASEDDAEATARALRQYLPAEGGTVIFTNVIEKAGGAPDKASVAQREEHAEAAFRTAAEELNDRDVLIETRITYGTDVAERIIETAADEDAAAIVFTPRGSSRWMKLLTGNVTDKLVEQSDLPIVVLPDGDENEVSDE
jgi:nucleotide-binding universal stress UspA family protein